MVVRFAAVALLLLVPAAAAAPLPPTGLDAERQGAAVLLSWDAAPSAAEYRVFRDGAAIATTSGTTYEDALAPQAGAVYWVTALDAAGVESAPSAPAAVTRGDCIIISQDTFPFVFVHPEYCLNAPFLNPYPPILDVDQ